MRGLVLSSDALADAITMLLGAPHARASFRVVQDAPYLRTLPAPRVAPRAGFPTPASADLFIGLHQRLRTSTAETRFRTCSTLGVGLLGLFLLLPYMESPLRAALERAALEWLR